MKPAEELGKQSWSARCARTFIRFYQSAISPMLGPRCRFYPTCSQYALEAIQSHGFLKGTWLSACRICKCHPFHPGGVDLVPPVEQHHQDCKHVDT